MKYDTRLDSSDVVTRQQAEIEALRTALIASNSESNGEVDRLRQQLAAMTESYEGQKRNTMAFMRERDELRVQLGTPVDWIMTESDTRNASTSGEQTITAVAPSEHYAHIVAAGILAQLERTGHQAVADVHGCEVAVRFVKES